LNKATQAWQIWLTLNAYIYGSQAFAKLFEQPSYKLERLNYKLIYCRHVFFFFSFLN